MLGLIVTLWLAVLILGTAAFADQPFLCIAAAALVAGVVLFLTRGTGLLARRRAREG
ncbi:hypothetical protein Q2K19_26535 [Micromonospora soli]|uniref:hypothetical protein n=1 Tax=Micromonospora sp. NBRC 110009 TaxID=3061627 RepID=UPI002673A48C|nr:hypothetical protein [Micromonospora sp. NBRC 110009]WKT97701.1 hypothetical protein Q2K19_26535 [Micromonospora sp. NBRC 110009]